MNTKNNSVVAGLICAFGLWLLSSQSGQCFYNTESPGGAQAAKLANATPRNVPAQYEYGPFGEVIRGNGPMARANPFRFSTKFQDDCCFSGLGAR
jgi:hypothetical protein